MTEPQQPITNTKTGQANSVGGYANTGVHIGDVNLFTGVPVHTWYREQVRRIVPQELLGREAELAELADFCTDPATRGRYSWWRAEAWAGKSALMSWFFLNPPPKVRLVSFFITARFASQNDRVSFGDNLIEQLAALLGVPRPQTTDSTRDVHLLGMLHDAAVRCQERGEDFVLIVDGLDEDRGVTTGRNAHSIAALLPMELPAGMRVIVTGRPLPPVPDDVPEHHPIRVPGIVRPLSTAPAAKVVRNDMLRELREILDGSQSEQALLGFLTVAGGGLTALDLADLTGKPAWRVEEYLRTVAGRSFTRRGGYWRPELTPEAYLLGHEELQPAAEELLGPEQLAHYRARLHEWADGYRDQGWPAETPEYLLRGYFQMLVGQSDIERQITFATDHVRHGRMLDASGGDAAALAEIAATQDILVAAVDVDLKSMACLAMHRDYLTERNVDIPAGLPAVWAALGQPARAEALIKSISDPSVRCTAALRVTRVLAGAENFAAAQDCVTQALAAVKAISDDEQRGEMAAAAIDVLIAIGRNDWAGYFVGAAPDESGGLAAERSRVVHGDAESLNTYLETLAPLDIRAVELSAHVNAVLDRVVRAAGVPAVTPTIMTEWLTDSGLPATAKVELASAARRLMAERRPTDALVASEVDEEVLAAVALAACTAGYLDAGALLVRHIENPARRVNAVTALATACVRAGDFDGAETLLSVCGGSEYRAEATMSLAAVYAETGALDRASDLILQRQFLIEEVMTEDGHTELKSKAAQAWTALGDFDQASRVARSLSGVNERAEVFTVLAKRAIDRGDFDVARGFATHAETYARMSVTTTTRVQGFTALARAYATVGNPERAENIAGVALSPDGEPSAEEHLATTFVDVGERERAIRIAHKFSPLIRDHLLVELVTAVDSADGLAWAVELARSVSADPARVRALAHCARLAASCGDLDQAIAIALAIPDATVRTEVAGFLIRNLACERDTTLLQTFIEWAMNRLDMNPAPGERRSAEHVLGVALAASGDIASATQVIMSVPEGDRNAVAITVLAVVASTGDENQARSLLELVDSPAARQAGLEELANAALVRGDLARANELVDELDDLDLRDRIRVAIAAAAAEAGQAALAGEVFDRIRAVEHDGWALATITAAGIVLPALNNVEAIVRRVTDPDARIDLLAALVEVMASAGRAEQAGELIRATSEPEHRGFAWAVLAENLVGDAARNAVALSFRWGRWTTALGRLARLEPDSLPGVEAEFFVLNPETVVEQPNFFSG